MQSKDSRASYNPLQPGYLRAGERYFERAYSFDCALGGSLSQMFEVEGFSDESVRVVPDGCNDIIVTFDGREVRSWLLPSIPRACTFHYRNLALARIGASKGRKGQEDGFV